MNEYTLEELLSGQHNDTLRELAAKSVGWSGIHVPADFAETATPLTLGKLYGFTPTHKTLGLIPNYPASLDAFKELRDALAEEGQQHLFMLQLKSVCGLCMSKCPECDEWICFNIEPLHLLAAFCLTRNLITLK